MILRFDLSPWVKLYGPDHGSLDALYDHTLHHALPAAVIEDFQKLGEGPHRLERQAHVEGAAGGRVVRLRKSRRVWGWHGGRVKRDM